MSRKQKETLTIRLTAEEKMELQKKMYEAVAPSMRDFILKMCRDGKIIADTAQRLGYSDYVFGKDMDECVKIAFAAAEPGDTVLLSPACASWDMYDNFEQRGKHFKECVMRLGI